LFGRGEEAVEGAGQIIQREIPGKYSILTDATKAKLDSGNGNEQEQDEFHGHL
jgi:hypothetical protein